MPLAGSPLSHVLAAASKLIKFKPQPTITNDPISVYLSSISGGSYTIEVCGEAGQTCHQGDTISVQLAQLATTQTTTFNPGFPVNLNLAFTGTSTITSTVATPEYPNYATIPLVAVLITLRVIATRGRNKNAT
jgi:hypothetical protein